MLARQGGGVPELHDPLPPEWRRTLRTAVHDYALHEPRRCPPPLLHVGHPGGTEVLVPATVDHPLPADEQAPDHALQTDLVATMLRRVAREWTRLGTTAGARAGSPSIPGPLVWLTRAGDLDVQDVDLSWLAAARAASAEVEADLTMVVVNRHGWRDPRTGTEVRWQRVRRR